jgi:hypothetical protein
VDLVNADMRFPTTQSAWTGVSDFTGAGKADLLWLTNTGAARIWQLDGARVVVSTPTTRGNVTVSGPSAANSLVFNPSG